MGIRGCRAMQCAQIAGSCAILANTQAPASMLAQHTTGDFFLADNCTNSVTHVQEPVGRHSAALVDGSLGAFQFLTSVCCCRESSLSLLVAGRTVTAIFSSTQLAVVSDSFFPTLPPCEAATDTPLVAHLLPLALHFTAFQHTPLQV